MPVYPGAPQRSTGPRTEEGKAKSSLNAIKTGLTGRTVLLPSDDIAAYQEHLASLKDQHKPETDAGPKPVGFEFSAREAFQKLAARPVFGRSHLKPFGEQPPSTLAETDTADDLPSPKRPDRPPSAKNKEKKKEYLRNLCHRPKIM